MKAVKKDKKTFFSAFYIFGLSLGIIQIIVLLLGYHNLYFPNVLLWFSLAYILGMFLYAKFKIPKPRIPIISNKIQVAGYLYTLIGFIISVLRLQANHLKIEEIYVPIGISLATSVLGWFLGGLLADEDNASMDISLKSETDKLANEIQSFSNVISKLHVEYAEAIKDATKEMKKLIAKQSSLYSEGDKIVEEMKKNSADLISNLNQSLEPLGNSVAGISSTLQTLSSEVKKNMGKEFVDSLDTINAGFKNLNTNVGESAKEAKNVADYLGQSRKLIDELKMLLDLIIKERSGK